MQMYNFTTQIIKIYYMLFQSRIYFIFSFDLCCKN